MIDVKTRVGAIIGSLILLLVIVDLVRRRKLKEEYSVLWVSAAVVLLILAIWYQLLGWITRLIGGVALSTTLFFMAFLFVLVMLLHFSLRVSSLERQLTALVQEVGLVGAIGLPRAAGGAGPAATRVAVIVPCFNDGELLPEALASVAEHEPVEVVVVDDGSTEAATLAVLDRLRGEGVNVVRRASGGLGAARTTGLGATSAEFVYPLDAGDRLEPGALAAMADALALRPSAGFAWGDYVLFGDQDHRHRTPDRWLPWTLTYVNPYPVASMFRRATLERAGGWEGGAYGDWDLWLRLTGLGVEGVRVDRSVYRRRVHGDSRLGRQPRRRHADLYRELQRRNASVFASRGDLRRTERPALWKLAVYPVLFGSRSVVASRDRAL